MEKLKNYWNEFLEILEKKEEKMQNIFSMFVDICK